MIKNTVFSSVTYQELISRPMLFFKYNSQQIYIDTEVNKRNSSLLEWTRQMQRAKARKFKYMQKLKMQYYKQKQAQQIQAQQIQAQQIQAQQIQAQQIQAQQIQSQQIHVQAQQIHAQFKQDKHEQNRHNNEIVKKNNEQSIKEQAIKEQTIKEQAIKDKEQAIKDKEQSIKEQEKIMLDPSNTMILIYEITKINTIIQLPILSIKGTVSIDWDDKSNTVIKNTVGNVSHTYKVIGTYKIIISAKTKDAEIERFGLDITAVGIQYLKSVDNWGNFNTTSLQHAFYGARNILNVPNILPTNLENKSIVKNMSGMFFNTDKFNQDISGWDVSSVTNMSFMFFHSRVFNQDISKWDVSNVTNFNNMFVGATSYKPKRV
jgi:surface protein